VGRRGVGGPGEDVAVEDVRQPATPAKSVLLLVHFVNGEVRHQRGRQLVSAAVDHGAEGVVSGPMALGVRVKEFRALPRRHSSRDWCGSGFRDKPGQRPAQVTDHLGAEHLSYSRLADQSEPNGSLAMRRYEQRRRGAVRGTRH